MYVRANCLLIVGHKLLFIHFVLSDINLIRRLNVEQDQKNLTTNIEYKRELVLHDLIPKSSSLNPNQTVNSKTKQASSELSNKKEVDGPKWNRVSYLDVGHLSTNRKENKGKNKYIDRSQRLDTSLEPIYFEPNFNSQQIPPPPAHLVGEPFEYYKNYLQNQRSPNNQINSFYSIDSDDNHNNEASQQNRFTSKQFKEQLLTPILLQSYNGKQHQLILDNLNKKQNNRHKLPQFNYNTNEANNRPKELDLRKFNFNTIQHAIENFNRSQDFIEPTYDLPFGKQQENNLVSNDYNDYSTQNNFSPNLSNVNNQAQQNQLYENLTLPWSPLNGQTDSRIKKNYPNKIHNYIPSIINRPSAQLKVVNLSSLLRPGEALLSQKGSMNENFGVQKISKINSKDISNIQNLLEPLKLKENEKAEAEKIKLIEELDDLNDEDDLDDKKEKLSKFKKEKRSQLVLPTNHLFGGSLGLVNESLINNNDNHNSSPEQTTKENNDDYGSFLDSLAQLSSKLRDKAQDVDDDSDDESIKSKESDEDFFEKKKKLSLIGDNNVDSNTSIPIDVLVDHLMSSSRLASFGLQHGPINVRDQQQQQLNSDQEEEEEEEDPDDNDPDNNGTLPVEAQGHIDAYESKLNEIKLNSPSIPLESSILLHFNGSADFNSIQNKTNSWVPLNSIKIKSKQIMSTDKNIEELSKIEKKLTHKKKKRLKRHKNSEKNGLNLLIGNKKISRNELIRLIRVLNKMASQKKPSKEREASRKLLKFLVKLALDDYKKRRMEKDTNNEVNMIRSILEGPTNIDKNKENSLIQLKTIGLIDHHGISNKLLHKSIDREEEPRFGYNRMQNKRQGGNNKGSKNAGSGGSLRLLSDELDNYFDSDFFEDLADKLNNTRLVNKQQVGNSPADSMLKRRRSSDIAYRLPVPIYGQEIIEAADEDDVELDHVRMPRVSGRRRRLQSNNFSKDLKDGTSTKKKATGNDYDDEDGDEEEDRNLSAKTRKKRKKNKRRRRNHKRIIDKKQKSIEKEKAREREERVDVENDEENSRPNRNSQVNDQNEKIENVNDDENPNDAEPEEPDPDVNNYSNDNVDVKDRLDKDSNDDLSTNKSEFSDKKRIYSKFKDDKKVESKLKKRKDLIDLDSRYEIPPPIKADKSNRTLKQKSKSKIIDNNHSETQSMNQKDTREVIKRKRNKKNNSKHKIRNRSLKKTNKKKRKSRLDNIDEPSLSAEIDENDPKEPDDNDPDYYNEGTSYSKVCDDDGKCKVTVESNSPTLSKAIKSGDKKNLVEKQLDKWANSGAD